jgi:hypothetical protein
MLMDNNGAGAVTELEAIKEQIKRSARDLLKRDPVMRGPFYVPESTLRSFLNEK